MFRYRHATTLNSSRDSSRTGIRPRLDTLPQKRARCTPTRDAACSAESSRTPHRPILAQPATKKADQYGRKLPEFCLRHTLRRWPIAVVYSVAAKQLRIEDRARCNSHRGPYYRVLSHRNGTPIGRAKSKSVGRKEFGARHAKEALQNHADPAIQPVIALKTSISTRKTPPDKGESILLTASQTASAGTSYTCGSSPNFARA